MRIISGKFKGRRLHAPAGKAVRPTADRVKEALFNILGPACRRATVLDLFAGTGALGLEALSRGASRAVFIDKSSRAIAAIKKNIALCQADEKALVICADAAGRLNLTGAGHLRFSLVFIDPPYDTALATAAMEQLLRRDLLLPDARIVVEHSLDKAPEPGPGFKFSQQRRYGRTMLSFMTYRPFQASEFC